METTLTRREAGLRAAAVAALCGLALVQAIELPYNLAQARQIAVLSVLLLTACVVLAVVLAAARRVNGAAAWGAVAATGAVVLAGWALTRAVALPGLASGTGDWTAQPGLASAALGLACLALAAAAGGVRPTRTAAAGIARAVALLAALGPAAGALIVALGPGPSGGESTIAEDAVSHAHLQGATAAATFRPGFGGHAGHYIYPNATPPHLPTWALALAVAAAALVTYHAAATLRRRAVATTLVALALVAAAAPAASAHATLLGSVPHAATHVAAAPREVRLTFTEAVQIVRPSDVSIVDGRGRAVGAGAPHSDPRDPRLIEIPVRRGLPPDSYTVRYRVISDDAHEVDDALVFALGEGRLRAPVLGGAGGLSETGPWAVAARFAELTALGLLLGLLAFRFLVWGPALRAAGHLRPDERAIALVRGSRLFWRAFWGVAGMAGLAEAAVLAAKSAVVFHTGLAQAVTDPQSAYRLVAASRFGDLLGWRGGLLLLVVAVAYWEWSREASGERSAGGRALPTALIGAASIGTLAMLSAQGHASQAPLAPLSITADAIHLTAAGVWIGGLPCLAAVLLRAPAALPDAGRRLAADVLNRFSRVALVAVVFVLATGLVRLTGELSRIGELWSTGYGRSILLKSLLLFPVAFIVLRSRRAIARLPAGGAAALRALRRNVRAELAIGLNIVLVAALLVAQVPGRDAPRARPPVALPAPTQTLKSPLVTGALPLPVRPG
jgi:copper transport protein